MKKLVFFSLAILVIFSLLLIGCGNDQTTAPTTTTAPATTSPGTTEPSQTTPAAGTPKRGGIMRVAGPPDPGGPFGWPADIIGAGSASAQPALECLLRQKSTGDYEPWLATSYEVAEDGKSITFKLREGVVFHDGSPFNAEVVKFNFDAQIESKKAAFWTSVDVIDEYTVRINLTQYTNIILDNFADSALGLIASKKSYEEKGREWAGKNPVGTGPFVFQSYQQNTKITYTRNENYWLEGKPYLDGLEIHFISDPLTMKAAMQSGELDMMNVSMGKQQKEMEDLGFLTAVEPMTTYVLLPDTANPESPFYKKEVREAVEYAIDKEAIAEGLGYGTWQPPYQLPPRANAAYDPNFTGARKYDPEKAKELLAQAGYPNGFDTVVYSAPAARQADAEAAIVAYLNEVGIRAELKNIDQASWVSYQTEGWTNGMLIPAIAGYANFNSTLNYYFGRNSTQHKSWEKSEELMALIDESLANTTPDINLIRKATNYMIENALVIPTTESGLGTAYASYVKDGGFTDRGMAIWWNMESVWLDK